MTETDWQTSLKAQDSNATGANISEGAIMNFGDSASELAAAATENVLCDLSHLGLLALSGEDATSFLQGQVTNDVQLLTGKNAHYNGYCTPKGRMLALFLTFSLRDGLYLQFSRPLLTSVMKRLKMYVMRAKVEIKDASDEMIRFGINGPDAAQQLAKIFATVPTKDYELATLEHAALLKLPSIKNHTRFEIITDNVNANSIWDALKENCQLVGKPCWDWLDIQTGTPDVLENTQEQFVPQMLNLDILDGINFKKGCYTGQEIIARTHYLGSVKRRTYLASIAANSKNSDTPTEGDKILDSGQNEVGQIVKAAPNLNDGFDALIEIRIEAMKAGNITWGESLVTFNPMPYSLETEGK